MLLGSFSVLGPVSNVVKQLVTRIHLMDELPPPNTTRWVARRKAAVVAAVRVGTITMEEALRRYQLTEEEFLSWHRSFESHGLPGLRTTRIQQYLNRAARGARRARR